MKVKLTWISKCSQCGHEVSEWIEVPDAETLWKAIEGLKKNSIDSFGVGSMEER